MIFRLTVDYDIYGGLTLWLYRNSLGNPIHESKNNSSVPRDLYNITE